MLGVEVVDERPYSWDLRGTRVMVYDFGLKLPAGADDPDSWDADGRQRFMDVVTASWTLRCEADNLNRLVVSAGLDWRQVSWLRGISRYLLQAGVPFSQTYIATAMNANPTLAAGLVAAYEIKFAPERFADDQEQAAALAQQYRWLREQLDAVVSLDHDRILRAFLAVIEASVRTNARRTRDVGVGYCPRAVIYFEPPGVRSVHVLPRCTVCICGSDGRCGGLRYRTSPRTSEPRCWSRRRW